ncbi:AAA family ATPase [Candidatus Palauibacter sp.]|uniref:AAA family ATPase n=1 Tax=Candidatus Palauibacter sp. TaxID=3101350 RepID=UPI003AF3029A
MRPLHYLEVRNFKQFGDAQRIELDHPTVLIGPNNCGKTTAIQAHGALVTGREDVVRPQGRSATQQANRDRAQPAEHRLRTRAAHPPVLAQHRGRTGRTDVMMEIALGVLHEGRVVPSR